MRDEMENIQAEEMDEEEATIITLTDDDGNEVEYEFLDSVDYEGKKYAVLIENSEEADEVEIFAVSEEGEDEILEPVLDEKICAAVFGIFKENNADVYDFD